MPIPAHIFDSLQDPARWFLQRDQYMEAARMNMAALMRPDGFWRYDRSHPELLAANRKWVARARRCHAIAMGRQSLISELEYFGPGSSGLSGPLFVKRAA